MPTRTCLVTFPSDYMRKHTDINARMRTILVDWMILVISQQQWSEDTLHVSCWLLDRFLSKRIVHRNKLQLIGAAALWIALKTEEVSLRDASYMVRISDGAYTLQQLLTAEVLMLQVLDFSIGHHTLMPFNWQQFRVYCTCPIRSLFTAYLFDASVTQYALVTVNKIVVLTACVLLSKWLVRQRKFPTQPIKYLGAWKLHRMDTHKANLTWEHCQSHLVPDFVPINHHSDHSERSERNSRLMHAGYHPLIKYGLIIPPPSTCCRCCHHPRLRVNWPTSTMPPLCE
jgi:hypothetical protein